MAFDMRGHGETTSSDDLDLSSNTLAAVSVAILSAQDRYQHPHLQWSACTFTALSSQKRLQVESEQVEPP